MQYELTGIWAIICVILVVVVLIKVAKKAIKLIAVVAIICIFLFGFNIISLNTLSPELQAKVDAVVEAVGDSWIRIDGNSVLVQVNDKWYDISKIAVVGDLATESVVLKYDDQEIYVGETGLVNVLRVLESVGLVQGD